VLVLLGIGLMMLFSIGIGHDRPLHYPVRQLVFATVAVIGAVVISRIPMEWWKQLLPLMMASSLVLLIMARAVGPRINGAYRWLVFGPVSFQPSEIGKLVAILWIARWLSTYRRRSHEFLRGFLLPVSGLGAICILVLAGPDFGTTVLIGGTGLLLMFIGGTRVLYLAGTLVSGAVVIGGLVWHDPERLSRITSFMNPEKYADDEAYQLMNSLYGFMQGGLTGKGIGQSLQKYSYLPEAHTDFILSILAEELGLFGTLAVMMLFVIFFLAGMTISLRSRDPFSRLVGLGITLLITLQAVINVGVVTGSMPTKGLPLPFISHGGSNLVVLGAMVGMLVRIALGDSEPESTPHPVSDSRQWI
jgi:cell division protein FtsW